MDILPYETEEEYALNKARTELTERLKAEAELAAYNDMMRDIRQIVCGDAFDFVLTQLELVAPQYADAAFAPHLNAVASIMPVLRNSVGPEPQPQTVEPEAE